MDIIALSQKYKALEELIFQVDLTEIGTGLMEAQGEKHYFFSIFLFFTATVLYLY